MFVNFFRINEARRRLACAQTAPSIPELIEACGFTSRSMAKHPVWALVHGAKHGHRKNRNVHNPDKMTCIQVLWPGSVESGLLARAVGLVFHRTYLNAHAEKP